MAKQLSNYQRTARPGPQPTYPWDQWFGRKGSQCLIEHGKDFVCGIPSMIVQVRRTAKDRGLRVSVFKHVVAGEETGLVITNLGKA